MSRAIRHRALWVALTVAVLILPFRQGQAASSEEVTITVTPVVEVSLSLSAATYAFGPIDVNTSTHSATAITLTNDGNVALAVSKQIHDQSNPLGWTAGTSAGRDTYVLYCATSAVRPGLSDFTAATQFGAEGQVSPLTGSGGSQPILPPTGAGQSVDLWFRLDMPTEVSHSPGRSITVRFDGTAQ